QRQFLETAGFTIREDGAIYLFEDDDNPLHKLANDLLQLDPQKRMSASDAMYSAPIRALSNPELQQNLKELRALIAQVPVDKTGKEKPRFNMTPEQRERYHALTNRIAELLETDKSGIWETMGV